MGILWLEVPFSGKWGFFDAKTLFSQLWGFWPLYRADAFTNLEVFKRVKVQNWMDAISCLQLEAFLLTMELFTYSWDRELFLLTIGVFIAYSFSSSTYNCNCFAYNGKLRQIRTVTDCKQRSTAVRKTAPTVSKKASPKPNFPYPEGPEIKQIHSRSNASKKTFPHARKNHSCLKFSFLVWHFRASLGVKFSFSLEQFSIPGLVCLRRESDLDWKKKHNRLKISFHIESLICSTLPLEIDSLGLFQERWPESGRKRDLP